eukprot:scaffold104854_cov51-Attheya_sp.AAC.2
MPCHARANPPAPQPRMKKENISPRATYAMPLYSAYRSHALLLGPSAVSLGLRIPLRCRSSSPHYHHHHRFIFKSQQANIDTDITAASSSVSSSKEYFILSFDGAVANTGPNRAALAIRAAMETWPHLNDHDNDNALEIQLPQLQNDNKNNNNNNDSGEKSWLLNKMEALLHVMQTDPDGMTTGCDLVLLVRLLLEEQKLDEGRSVGKTGKYASQFHPKSTSSNSNSNSQRRTSETTGSRPLTVGEISANWSDGGYLSESCRIRYNIDGSDPLPIIKRNLLKLQEQQDCSLPICMNLGVLDAISDCCHGNIIITVGHECMIPHVAEYIEKSLHMDVDVLPSSSSLNSSSDGNMIAIVSPNNADDDDGNDNNKKKKETQTELIQRLVEGIGEVEKEEDSTVFVIHSSLRTLEEAKGLFGDDSPRMRNGIGTMSVVVPGTDNRSIHLSLLLPSWADGTSPQQQVTAEMDPWLNVVTEEEFSELLSARIIASDPSY